jgi:hypothetical protein
MIHDSDCLRQLVRDCLPMFWQWLWGVVNCSVVGLGALTIGLISSTPSEAAAPGRFVREGRACLPVVTTRSESVYSDSDKLGPSPTF